MKDIELPPLPDADVTNSTNPLGYRYSYSAIAVQSYARAAVEADRAQRVPDDFLSHRSAWRAAMVIAEGFAANEDDASYWRHELKAFDNAYSMLASTPAPAQQEPMEAFLVIDLSRELGVAASELTKELRDQGIGNYSVNMALPKAAADAMRRHFKAAITHQEPPQQERGPMADAEREQILRKWRGGNWSAGDIMDAVERHHGIKE